MKQDKCQIKDTDNLLLAFLHTVIRIVSTYSFVVLADGEPEVVSLLQLQYPLNQFSRLQL